jgi:hypothetical protein
MRPDCNFQDTLLLALLRNRFFFKGIFGTPPANLHAISGNCVPPKIAPRRNFNTQNQLILLLRSGHTSVYVNDYEIFLFFDGIFGIPPANLHANPGYSVTPKITP